jgi:Protein of unknown function (DUF2865)
LRNQLPVQRKRRRLVLVAAAIAVPVALAPGAASAEGLFDFLFGGLQKAQQHQASPQANFFADPFGTNPQASPPPRPAVASSGPAFCVRSCDGRYFPLMRGSASPVQMCQAFCPASPTRVFFGSSIDSAYAANGERYADSENAFVYRKELRANCTCNGRGPAGLAPVDLTLDSSLRPGDVVATTNGLVAYSGSRANSGQSSSGQGSSGQNSDFIPVASYPGLTADTRARLGEMKVAPVSAEMIASDAPLTDVTSSVTPATTTPKRNKRAEAN